VKANSLLSREGNLTGDYHEGQTFGSTQSICSNVTDILKFLVFKDSFLLTSNSAGTGHSTQQSPSWKAGSRSVFNKFTILYAIRRYIAVSTKIRHWSLPWVRCIRSRTSHPISLGLILILVSHLLLDLPSGLLLSDFRTKILYVFLISQCVPLVPPIRFFLNLSS